VGRRLIHILRSGAGTLSTQLAVGLIVVLLVITVGVLGVLYQGSPDGEIKDIIIPRKATLTQVSEILSEQGVIHQSRLFKILLRLTRGASKVRAGEFRFREGMRAIDALMVLYHGEPIVHQITVPEGWTARQIAQILAAEKLIDEKRFLDLTLTAQGPTKYKVESPTLEGYLFPDTYAFSKVDGEERIIDRMVQTFLQKYDHEFRAEVEKSGMSMNDFVTLASIVEKETGADGERELVSSVFHNRLNKKMKLQSDPTTIYGIPDFNGNLTRADLHRYSPYNTYVIPSLPPGPIANPGLAALRATLHPATTKYLYFVSNNHGRHLFSETYEQHARRVNTFQVVPFSHSHK
jgi:UPF0755 protein